MEALKHHQNNPKLRMIYENTITMYSLRCEWGSALNQITYDFADADALYFIQWEGRIYVSVL